MRTTATLLVCGLLLITAGVGIWKVKVSLQPRGVVRGFDWRTVQPSPDLSPAEVVRVQLAALRNNDTADAGVAACFRFSSPGNQAQTGPVERFGEMVKRGDYAVMLRYTAIRYFPPRIEGDAAQQAVVMVDRDGTAVGFVFLLTRQSDPPHTGCWMTDGVRPIPVPEGLAPRSTATRL